MKIQQLTLKQVEDWLIYHCPLQKSTKEIHTIAKAEGFKNCTIARLPFMVVYKCTPELEFVAVHGTPWQCYRELARMVWIDIIGYRRITDIYYQS